MTEMVLLGDEALAMGAVHAGISAAYAYPGTPSTEITEFLIRNYQKHGKPYATWSTNEKTAYEEALGVSMVGKRALVSMKHVGLNVAADPFMNSAIVEINGGLVVAVADDPGMHSSQNEQDSRVFADFSRIICLEPADQQQAYEMTREAYDLSERFHIPIMLRLVTRLAHSRAVVTLKEARDENPIKKSEIPSEWILLPSNARKNWRTLLERQKEIQNYTETCMYNPLTINENNREMGIITTGLGRNYYMENIEDIPDTPSHLHIGAYPAPVEKIRKLAEQVKTITIMEDGYPFVERYLRGILPTPVEIRGKESGHLPPDGELNPDIIRDTLGLPKRSSVSVGDVPVAGRPPQLCQGCPHADTFDSIKQVLTSFENNLVASDIGCYTLGALPPYSAIHSCVCMGASISMAVGAAAVGYHPVVAVIGDSTFLHSGVTGLMDAVATNANMTLLILDNMTVGMTGGQPTILPSSRLETVVKGVGVDPDHFHIIEAHRKHTDINTEIIGKEVDYRGLSVIIAVRECIETVKKKKKG